MIRKKRQECGTIWGCKTNDTVLSVVKINIKCVKSGLEYRFNVKNRKILTNNSQKMLTFSKKFGIIVDTKNIGGYYD